MFLFPTHWWQALAYDEPTRLWFTRGTWWSFREVLQPSRDRNTKTWVEWVGPNPRLKVTQVWNCGDFIYSRGSMGISKLPGIQPCGRVRWVRVQAASEQSNGMLKNILSWTHDHVHKTAISLSDSCTIILRRPPLGTSRFTSLRTQTPLRTPTTQRHLSFICVPNNNANPMQNTTEPFGGVEVGWHGMVTFTNKTTQKNW